MDAGNKQQLSRPLLGGGGGSGDGSRRGYPLPAVSGGVALGSINTQFRDARTEGYAALPQGDDRPPAPKVTALGVVEVRRHADPC
jgi:hypothetical protein